MSRCPIRMTTFEFRRGKLKFGPSTSIDETASLYFYGRRGKGIESTSGYPIVPFAKVTETILSNWSAIRKQFEPVVDLLMTVMYSSQLHSETRFLLAIQGIEAFDRISRPEHLVPSDDYKKITSLMLTAIPPNTPKIVRDKLKTTLLYA